MRRLTIALLLAPVASLACSSAKGVAPDAGARACDPLAAPPITLGAVVGVGHDATGTLYVDAAHGIFVSDSHNDLMRQHVLGTGQSGTTEFSFFFAAPGADESSARNLLVETRGATAKAMAVAPSGTDPKAFLSQSPPGTTPLTLVDPSTLASAGMTLVNTPNLISYIADIANGDVLLATVPLNEDETSTDLGLTIFYGPPGAVAQRPVTAFEESLSGNGTLTFTVDGTPYVLAFGEDLSAPDAGPLGVFALMGLTPQGGATLTTTLRSPTPTALPAGLVFTCGS